MPLSDSGVVPSALRKWRKVFPLTSEKCKRVMVALLDSMVAFHFMIEMWPPQVTSCCPLVSAC